VAQTILTGPLIAKRHGQRLVLTEIRGIFGGVNGAERFNFRWPLPHVAGSPVRRVLSASLASIRSSVPPYFVGLECPYKLTLNLIDLPCSPAILRLGTGGTKPGSISAHLPQRTRSFCLSLFKRGSTTSITFISGPFCRSLDSGLQPPCLRFVVSVTVHHATLGTRLLAQLCRGSPSQATGFQMLARRNSKKKRADLW
jgi:hypothetical protein